jgi:acetylornithine deacetylase
LTTSSIEADPLGVLAEWIDVPSVTGAEADYGDLVGRFLAAEGLGVEHQEVEPGRFNVLARGANPDVVFCTHLDTVPPFFGPRIERGVIYGRGACDAKGQALAMLLAARRLLREGEERIGFLLTVGEETDSAGAKHADRRLAEPWNPRYVVVGEPTDNTFVRGHKGIYKCRLHAHGVAGHSSQDVGPSAIHELVGALERILGADWGADERFGGGTINVGHVSGGLAANVVAPDAAAELLLRIVEDPTVVTARLTGLLGPHVELVEGKGYGPLGFHVPPGADSIAVAFGTDAPYLPRWGTPLLYGPGRILDAHTADEKLSLESLERAVDEHVRTVRRLLAEEA